MKLTVGKRIALFIHSAMSILICILMAFKLIFPDLTHSLFARMESSMGALGIRVAGIVLLVIYAALAVAQMLWVLNRRKQRAERGFINVGSDDTGRVRIAVSAVEQMVRQSLHGIDGIDEMKINIEGQDDSINIDVNAIVNNGSHVPTITRNMQRSIRQFVEVNCGVTVNAISISIDAVTAHTESQRKRIWGRGRPGKGIAAGSVPQQSTRDVPEVNASPEVLPEDSSEAISEPMVSEPSDDALSTEMEPKALSYDFEKPYESQFAKDLAAMQAREAAEMEEASHTITDNRANEEPGAVQ